MREFILKRPTFLLLMGLIWAGCAGSPGVKKAITKSSERFKTTYENSGLPGWVNRGSAAISEDNGKVFYGVGSASSIRNPALLRTTSDNRARNELAKILEVFSSSLMKDQMASSEEQAVEQAIETVNANSLKGVEIVDRYIDSNGGMYSLAALDLEVVAAAVRRAEELGVVKANPSEETIEAIFGNDSKESLREKPLRAGQADVAASTIPKTKPVSNEPPPEYDGDKPGWVDGYDKRFPYNQFLCGVGFGPSRSGAQNGAYGALAKIFVAHVKQTSTDFMGAYTKTGARALDVQSSETLTEVATEKVFTGVELRETWTDSDQTIYALACLDRQKASRGLIESIEGLDKKAKKLIDDSAAADRTDKVRKLANALDALVQREAMNAQLRIIDVSGIGVAGPLTYGDIAIALEEAVEALRVGIEADSKYSDDFRGGLIDALAKKGYSIIDDTADENLDVLVRATIRVEDGGKGTGRASSIYFARVVVQVEVVQVEKKRLLGSVSQSRKEGHRNLAEAERLAVRKLAKMMSHKVGAKIDMAMKGL